MKLKDAVEKRFKQSLEAHPDQDFIISLDEHEYRFDIEVRNNKTIEFIRGRVLDFFYAIPIISQSYLAKDALGEAQRESFVKQWVEVIKGKVNIDNRQQVSSLLKDTIKQISDKDLIKTYGMYNDFGSETFLAEVPNHEMGLFYAGGIYPVYWGKEMNTIKFIKSPEYRKSFVNDVMFTIIDHCEENAYVKTTKR